MEKRIELEKRGRTSEEITELNLDNCRSTQMEGLTDDFKNLKSLSLNNVGLTTLKSFPNLPQLKKLELSDNRLCDSLGVLTATCPKLSHLNLSGNKIKDLDTLESLKDLKELKNLDLFNCEVTGVESYREKVFKTLPDLVYLDGFDRNDLEAEEDDDDENGEGSEDEVNGENGEEDDDDDDEDDDEEEDDDDEDDEDEEDEVGLSYLQKSGLEEEDSEGEEFQPNGTHDDDEDDDDDESDEEGLDEEELEEEEGEEEKGTEKSPAGERGRGIKRKRVTTDEESGKKEKETK